MKRKHYTKDSYVAMRICTAIYKREYTLVNTSGFDKVKCDVCSRRLKNCKVFLLTETIGGMYSQMRFIRFWCKECDTMVRNSPIFKHIGERLVMREL